MAFAISGDSLLASVAQVTASEDTSTLATQLAKAIHDVFGKDAEVAVVQGERELARARHGAASARDVRISERVAASHAGVDVAISGPIDAEARASLVSLVQIAAMRAHQHSLLVLAQNQARERQEIVSIVSHDLRTPLQSLGLGLDALDMLISGTSAATPCASTIARMQRSVATMGRLLGDLLDVSRIHDGALSVHVRTCDTAKLIREMAEQHAPLAAAKGFTFHASAPEGGAVMCDASRMTQALSNFVSNAIRHATQGPIELRATTRGDVVRFEVEDRGPGIPSEVRAQLFDRLYQAQDGGRRGGLGLGLYIAKGIAAAHGARIGVDSEVGRGSTFWIEIDQRSAASRPASRTD